jgi:plastocyanin
MNLITLFGLATFGLAVAGVAADAIACDVEADQSAATSAVQVAAGPAEAATIKIFQFQPRAIEVRAGTTVTWTNEDNIDHTVTSGTPETPVDNFDSGGFGRGQSFSAVLHTPGDYAYFCAKHKSMRGMVRVLPAE